MKELFLSKGAAALVTAALLGGATMNAGTLDLTGATTSGTINSGFFIRTDAQATGSGAINSFVRIQDNANVEDGYNADARPVMPQVNTSPSFTRDVQLSSVATVNLSGINYYEFLLDINQKNSDPLLSLDKLQIYTRGTALVTANTLAALTAAPSVLRYNLDAGSDSEILLDYSLNSGSGSGDMFAYIPMSVFGANTDYVYLYSQFGGKGGAYVNNDGFEEWAYRTAPVPEPGALALLTLGGMGFFASRRKRSA